MNWKTMVVLGSLLWLMLSCFAASVNKATAEEITTNNLLDKNFDAGSWSGTADGRHGSNVIAAEHNTYIQSNNVSVKNDANLTEVQLQNGFTTNHQFEYWHWNTYESNVKSTITITGANGETTTQIRNYTSDSCGSNNCGSFSVGSDTSVVLSNLQTDYNLSVRYDFTDSSNVTNAHYGVDLREPSLTVTYESQPIELEVQNTIQNLFEDFKIEEDLKFKEETFTEPMLDNFSEDKVMKDSFNSYKEEVDVQTLEESKEIKQEVKQEIKEEIKQEVKQEVTKEEEKKTATVINNEEEKESNSKTTTASSVSTKESKEPKDIQSKKVKTKTVSLKAKLNNVDVNVKDVSKNLELKNLIKLNAILNDEVSLSTYTNAVFYKSKEIYSNQDLMLDNRLLYANVTLDVYVANDPLVIKQQKLNKIKYEKQKLILQIQELRNE
jgi:hypothetical protein